MSLSFLATRQLYSLFPQWGSEGQQAYQVMAGRHLRVEQHSQVPWWVLCATGHAGMAGPYLHDEGELVSHFTYEAQPRTFHEVMNFYAAHPAFTELFTELRARRGAFRVAPPTGLSEAAGQAVRKLYGVEDTRYRLMLEFSSADVSRRFLRLWEVKTAGLKRPRQRAWTHPLSWEGSCETLMGDPDSTVVAARTLHNNQNATLTKWRYERNPAGQTERLSHLLVSRLTRHPNSPDVLADNWFTREVLRTAGITDPHVDVPRWLLFSLP